MEVEIESLKSQPKTNKGEGVEVGLQKKKKEELRKEEKMNYRNPTEDCILSWNQCTSGVFKELMRKEKVISSLQRQLKQAHKKIQSLQKSSIQRIHIPVLKHFYLDLDAYYSKKAPVSTTDNLILDIKDEDDGDLKFNDSVPHISTHQIFTARAEEVGNNPNEIESRPFNQNGVLCGPLLPSGKFWSKSDGTESQKRIIDDRTEFKNEHDSKDEFFDSQVLEGLRFLRSFDTIDDLEVVKND